MMDNPRFINPGNEEETKGLILSTLRHPSLDMGPTAPIIKFYRGPLPATNTRPDNVFNYYQTRNYKSQRSLQPNIGGSL